MAEDIPNQQDSSNVFSVSESGLVLDSVHRSSDSLAGNPVDEDDGTRTEKIDIKVGDIVYTENDPTEIQEDVRDWSSDMEISIETDEVICFEDKLNGHNLQVHAASVTTDVQEEHDTLSSRLHADNGYHEVQAESHLHHPVISATVRSGVKRARMAIDDQQPSVHVIYNSITRASKKRLQELLRQWSECQAEDCSSNEDPNNFQSGEETYFPALRVGTEKCSAVSFWIDSQISQEQHKGFVPPESNCVPLYDRGCALCLTSEDGSNNLSGSLEMIGNASRCFNCGSYSHSLKECPKPRDNDAVNKARNQYMAKKKQRGGSCNPIRYYEKSHGGKYDDLKPGVLSGETRKLLGLKEFDPPPWLNRMRELGYPPGYLAPVNEDQPSGITIFADEETEENEDAEVIQLRHSQEKLKKTVEFPGINASIPAGADAKRWASVSSSSADPSRSGARQQSIHNYKPESTLHHGQGLFPDCNDEGPPGIRQGFSSVMSHPPTHNTHIPSFHFLSRRDYGEGPPGISQALSPVMSYPPRYGNLDASLSYHSPQSYRVPGSRSSILDRSLSETSSGRRLGYDDGPPGIDAHDLQWQGYGYHGR